MRSLLHLLSILLALPGIALAGMFLVLGHAIATQSLFGFFGELLAVALWLIPWGLIGIAVAVIALIAGGLLPRCRRFAAAVVALLTIASSAVVFKLSAVAAAPGQLAFFVPAWVAVAISVWLAVTEKAPRRPAAALVRGTGRSC